MKKNILLIAHFSGDFDKKDNDRFNYISTLLAANDFDLELLTSDFSHSKKDKRPRNANSPDYKVTYISEPAYFKNVSFKRFYSHFIMGVNLNSYLTKRKIPDIIYCAVPSLNVAKVAARYARRNNIRFIIDIQDLWPEAFRMIFNYPLLSDIIFYPMARQANYVYKSASQIVAVSQTYLNRALEVNKDCTKAICVFLGTELKQFDMIEKNKALSKPTNEIWLAYIGTLGYSYDIEMVIDALLILKEMGVDNIKFMVIGDGPLKTKFQAYAIENIISTIFWGRLGYDEMVSLLKSCDIAINPIRSGSAGSIINKVGDYAAAGLPVVNTQESKEYRDLLEEYNAGFNCINGDPVDVAEKILELANNKELRENMGKNNRILAEMRFDRENTYKEIIHLIKGLE